MNILRDTLYYLDKYNLQAKKKFGQNFLIDNNILENIVKQSGITKNDYVIEVGPGLGNLSRYISKYAKKLDCYEIDQDMVEVLKESLSDSNNVDVFLEDILKTDLDKYKDQELSVIANLPYYITTAILFKFLESEINVKSFTLMMQKEVAMRIVGKVSTKDYNALSVILQYKTIPELLFNVSSEVFIPKPKVDSSVIKLTVKNGHLTNEEELFFIETTKACFAMRRKTLVNNISQYFKLTKNDVTNILDRLGIEKNVRAENVSVDQFIELSKEIYIVTRETK